MELSIEKLIKLLVKPGHVNEKDFIVAQKEAERKHKSVEDILIEKDWIKDDQLGKLIAEDYGFRFANLSQEKIDSKIMKLVPGLVASSRGVVAFGRTKEGIKLGMRNPDDLPTRHLLEKRLGERIIPYYITKTDLQEFTYRYGSTLGDEFKAILIQFEDESLTQEERDEATVKLVDLILEYGFRNKASDIHIEPYNKKLLVRFRIDGVMHDVLEIPKSLAEFILFRIKILARMRTDEHRAAQDGKLRFSSLTGTLGGGVGAKIRDFFVRKDSTKEEIVDVRVSIVPVTAGENVVMRLLSSKSRQYSLESLGLLGKDFKKVSEAVVNPHGMILSTGPTGCGKTTTLYSIMKILNKREVNIATIEDPVEYDIEGVSQIQVNPKTNLTFAQGLRAIVRQDPDIIMVGEIRDEETADIAVNSALTGHLVLSTLHTNDAATTLPRLVEMKIEPFLVASTINIVIAQRLVRKICAKCRASYSLSKQDKLVIEHNETVKLAFQKRFKSLGSILLYKGMGCKVCNNTGYSGRVGIFEILEMNEEIRNLIFKRTPSNIIMQAAIESGMSTMLEDGLKKIFNGVTTMEEVLRVTRE